MQQSLFLKPDTIWFPQAQTEGLNLWLSLSAHNAGGPLPLSFVLINRHIFIQHSISNHSFPIIIGIDRNIATALQKECKHISKPNPITAYGTQLGLLLFLRKKQRPGYLLLTKTWHPYFFFFQFPNSPTQFMSRDLDYSEFTFSSTIILLTQQ